MKTILNIALQLCANIAVAFEPFTPFMSEKLAKMLGLSGKLTWDMLGKLDIISAGTTLATPELLFDKIEDSGSKPSSNASPIQRKPTKQPHGKQSLRPRMWNSTPSPPVISEWAPYLNA